MENSYRHIYLYAKGWYQKEDVINDIKIIIGKRAGLGPKRISTSCVVEMLVELVWKSIVRSGNPPHFFGEFVNDITFKSNWWKFGAGEEAPIEVAVINKCLSVLSLTEKANIEGELGKPDQEVLPLSKEAIK